MNQSALVPSFSSLACATVAVALAAIPPPASADGSVELYGNVDLAVVASRSGAPGARTLKQEASGISNGSLWGLRGSEDLGNGLKAIFVLESGFSADTGALTSYQGNPSTATPTSSNGTSYTGFNRRSVVGLEGRYGTLTFGRDYTPVYYAVRHADVFRLGMFANLQETVALSGGAERSGRVSNAIFYASPLVYGFRGRAVYSFGSESAGGVGNLPTKANVFMALGVEYNYSGLRLTSSYQRIDLPTVAGTPAAFTGSTSPRKDGLIGLRYQWNGYEVTSGFWKVGAPQNASDLWLGGSMRIGLGNVLVEVQKMSQDNPTGEQRRATSLGVTYVYFLSKRSSLYASYGQVNNNATSAIPVIASDASIAAGGYGMNPKVLGLGIRHNF